MSKPLKIDRDRLLERFEYSDEDCCLLNKVTGNRHQLVRKLQYGYPKVYIDKKYYTLSRVVWILMNGDIPEGMVIDHIDRDKNNNKIDNLRVVTQSDNNKNRVNGDMNTLREKQRRLTAT